MYIDYDQCPDFRLRFHPVQTRLWNPMAIQKNLSCADPEGGGGIGGPNLPLEYWFLLKIAIGPPWKSWTPLENGGPPGKRMDPSETLEKYSFL